MHGVVWSFLKTNENGYSKGAGQLFKSTHFLVATPYEQEEKHPHCQLGWQGAGAGLTVKLFADSAITPPDFALLTPILNWLPPFTPDGPEVIFPGVQVKLPEFGIEEAINLVSNP
jgi:hypothetical protein